MITLEEYVGPHADSPDWTVERKANAAMLLEAVNRLLSDAKHDDVDLELNPQTESLVSGVSYGGFRPQVCPQGAPHSSHKEGMAVDIFDPEGTLDRWINDAKLDRYNLYREAPESTLGWCHLSSRAPGSGKRTFLP